MPKKMKDQFRFRKRRETTRHLVSDKDDEDQKRDLGPS